MSHKYEIRFVFICLVVVVFWQTPDLKLHRDTIATFLIKQRNHSFKDKQDRIWTSQWQHLLDKTGVARVR